MMYEDLIEKNLNCEKIYDGRVFTVEKWRVLLPDGAQGNREIVKHSGGAAIVAVDEELNVYLVEQFRNPIQKVTLEIPAGKLDREGEGPFEGAKRELEEETGLRAGEMELLTAEYSSPGYSSERIYIYLAAQLTQHDTHFDEHEFLHVKKMPMKEALRMVMNCEICDGKTVAGLLFAARKLGI